MGDGLDYCLGSEEDRLSFHNVGMCDGVDLCSICTFRSLNRLVVVVGKHIYFVSWLWKRKGETFPIHAFLTSLGPFCMEDNGYVIRKDRMTVSALTKALKRFADLDVKLEDYSPHAQIIDVGGRIIGHCPNPLAAIFKLEDRSQNKLLW